MGLRGACAVLGTGVYSIDREGDAHARRDR